MKQMIALFKRFAAISIEKPIFFNAAAISFNVLICILPIALLLISALGFILTNADTYTQIERALRDFLPSFLFELLEQGGGDKNLLHQLIDPIIENRNLNGIIGILALSLFSQGLFSSIGHSLHTIFSVEDEKPAWRIWLRNYLTFGLVGGLFVASSFSVQALSIIDGFELQLPWLDRVLNVSTLWQWINLLLSQFITTSIVYLLFRNTTGMPVSRKTAIIGGLLFTFLLESAKFFLSMYFSYAFETYKSFYEGYSLIIMFTLWLYYIGVMFNIAAIGARACRDTFHWET